MIPLNKLEMITGDFAAGDIVIGAGRGIGEPRLIFDYSGQLHGLALAGPAEVAFSVCMASAIGYGAALRVKGWRLEVDPESALTGTRGSPDVGACYIDAAGGGFIGKMNFSQIHVGLSGTMLPGSPDYLAFASFGKWRIVIDLPQPSEVFILAAYDSANPAG